MNRRELLRAMGLTAFASQLPALAFASADTDARLVLVVLRGAVDGLAMAAPYGDRNYRAVDPEGARWIFSTQVREVPFDEMKIPE